MKYGSVALFSLLLCASCSTPPAEEPPADLLITNVIIVSPEREVPSAPANVIIDNGRILRITDTPVPVGAAIRHIEGEGRFLTPGYIDAHVHLAQIPGMRPDQELANPEISAEARAQFPRSYLYYGFTTLIDLASAPELVAPWNSVETGPKVHFCGAVTIQDGYPTGRIPKPQRYRSMPNFIFDPARPDEFPDGYDPQDHSPENLVEKIADSGAVCVKSFYEAGFGGRDLWPVPSEEILRRTKAAAHKRDLPFLLHANSENAQRVGAETGPDAFVHGMWTWNTDDTELTESVETILDSVIEQEIHWQPTIQVLYGELDLLDPDYLSHPELVNAVPQSLIEWYRSEQGQWYSKAMAEAPNVKALLEDGRWQETYDFAIARVNSAFRYLDRNGGLLMFGSDTPSDVTYANPPGLNGWKEMQHWLENGVSPEKLFKAATLENAAFFGLDEEIGTVEEGKRADLLILRGNPMEDGNALNMIDVVIAGGAAHEREALSAINN